MPVRHLRALALTAALTVLLGGPAVALGSPTAAATSTGNPLAGAALYVDSDSLAAAHTGGRDGASVRVLARTPQAKWFGDAIPTSQVAARVNSYVTRARRAHRVPVLTLYAIPQRNCGHHAGRSLKTAAAYAAWVRQVSVGIHGRRAAVVLEPDAVAEASCLSAKARAARYAMLGAAVRRLTSSAGTSVYVDAGHSGYLTPAQMNRRLRKVGLGRARGFSLNVAAFQTTAAETAYGERLSTLLRGRHYVVDTSRNGRGPAPASAYSWCNARGRAIGVRPTTRTAGAHADAYLWVKRPGESDGPCGHGDPAAGKWFQSYAVGLVKRAA